MAQLLVSLYRSLPWFRGKLRIGKSLFKNRLFKKAPLSFTAHYGLRYTIPNTLENLGIELYINGVYEKDIVDFLKRNIPDNSLFFDIGANIGSIALPILKSRDNVKYFGFEASPMVFAYLQKNFAQNAVSNCTLENKLVHKDDGQQMKFYQAEQYGKSSMAPTYATDHVMVNSVSVDQYCTTHAIDRIDWMKVDVQGFELYVFEGMVAMLQQQRIHNILFEFEAWADEQAGLTPGVAQRFLQEQGYVLYGLDGKPLELSSRKHDTMIWAKTA